MTHLHDKPSRTAEQSAAAWTLLILCLLVAANLVAVYALGTSQKRASDTADQLQRASQNQPRQVLVMKRCPCGECRCCSCQEVRP